MSFFEELPTVAEQWEERAAQKEREGKGGPDVGNYQNVCNGQDPEFLHESCQFCEESRTFVISAGYCARVTLCQNCGAVVESTPNGGYRLYKRGGYGGSERLGDAYTGD